ncbi:MAG: hypothetical protein PHV34_23525 [Verrucomicrobiae bacterium]|nr:hypothetical protein [Verrucomicrobiae bacterium]
MMKVSEKNKPVVTVVSILLIIASLTSIYFTQCSGTGTPKLDLTPYQTMGEVTAQETSKMLENKGQIVLMTMDLQKQPNVVIDASLKSFQEAIKKTGVAVKAIEAYSPGTNDMEFMMMESLPPSFYIRTVEKHSDADALVSFLGAPRLTDEQLRALPQKLPKLVAIASFGPPFEIKKLFEERVLNLAIVPRMTPPDPNKKPSTPREKFDANFQVVTSADAGSLP